MNEDLIKITGVLFLGLFIIYLIMKTFTIKEGLENATAPSNGEAGNAASYAAALKAKTVQLQDSLLISKYRTDYENVIINMDDYLSMSMLKLVLDMDNSADVMSNIATLTAINTLSQAKKTLNETMAFIDKQ
uniref:Uncharacterized protein n=1 Tax=viral metagenome TaxID=1070528 RepID=A0A6C0E2L2_9ZZZZ